jgi:hypothetical protein
VSFIGAYRERWGIEPVCTALQVAPSTYYAALSRRPSARQVSDERLTPHLAGSDLPSQERLDRGRMTLARLLLVGHAAALVFGLGGMLIAIPHPELWSSSALGQQVFVFGMQYVGAAHMVLGAAAMFAFAVVALGWRRTLIFFGLGLRALADRRADRHRHGVSVRQ